MRPQTVFVWLVEQVTQAKKKKKKIPLFSRFAANIVSIWLEFPSQFLTFNFYVKNLKILLFSNTIILVVLKTKLEEKSDLPLIPNLIQFLTGFGWFSQILRGFFLTKLVVVPSSTGRTGLVFKTMIIL